MAIPRHVSHRDLVRGGIEDAPDRAVDPDAEYERRVEKQLAEQREEGED